MVLIDRTLPTTWIHKETEGEETNDEDEADAIRQPGMRFAGAAEDKNLLDYKPLEVGPFMSFQSAV